jgi:hypothetical protein
LSLFQPLLFLYFFSYQLLYLSLSVLFLFPHSLPSIRRFPSILKPVAGKTIEGSNKTRTPLLNPQETPPNVYTNKELVFQRTETIESWVEWLVYTFASVTLGDDPTGFYEVQGLGALQCRNIQCVPLAGSPGKCWFTKRTKVQYICMSYL